jgi:hypothetical protein
MKKLLNIIVSLGSIAACSHKVEPQTTVQSGELKNVNRDVAQWNRGYGEPLFICKGKQLIWDGGKPRSNVKSAELVEFFEDSYGKLVAESKRSNGDRFSDSTFIKVEDLKFEENGRVVGYGSKLSLKRGHQSDKFTFENNSIELISKEHLGATMFYDVTTRFTGCKSSDSSNQ